MLRIFQISFLLAICSASNLFYLTKLRSENIISHSNAGRYLPDVRIAQVLALGYTSLAGKIYWFLTTSYFGNEVTGNRDFKRLSQFCKVTTKLDARSEHKYQFCATILPWFAKDPKAAVEILNNGIEVFPDNWELWYRKAFTKWYFMDDLNGAGKDMAIAAKLPDAPEMITRVAAKLLAGSEDPQTAVDLLTVQILNAKDLEIKNALNEKLKEAILTRDLFLLQNSVNQYFIELSQHPSSLEDLITAGYLKSIPPEPFGGIYRLVNNKVENTSGRKPLEFRGFTAKTGSFKNEF